jgi:hypothetical protein
VPVVVSRWQLCRSALSKDPTVSLVFRELLAHSAGIHRATELSPPFPWPLFCNSVRNVSSEFDLLRQRSCPQACEATEPILGAAFRPGNSHSNRAFGNAPANSNRNDGPISLLKLRRWRRRAAEPRTVLATRDSACEANAAMFAQPEPRRRHCGVAAWSIPVPFGRSTHRNILSPFLASCALGRGGREDVNVFDASLPSARLYRRCLEVRLVSTDRLDSFPTKSTVVFRSTILASFLASQLVRRTHPWDCVLLT